MAFLEFFSPFVRILDSGLDRLLQISLPDLHLMLGLVLSFCLRQFINAISDERTIQELEYLSSFWLSDQTIGRLSHLTVFKEQTALPARPTETSPYHDGSPARV